MRKMIDDAYPLPGTMTALEVLALAESRLQNGEIDFDDHCPGEFLDWFLQDNTWFNNPEGQPVRYKSLPLSCRVCTDTEVGTYVHYFDGMPFAISNQVGRKCERRIIIVHKDVYALAKAWARSFLEEDDPCDGHMSVDDLGDVVFDDGEIDVARQCWFRYDSTSTVTAPLGHSQVTYAVGGEFGRPTEVFAKAVEAVKAKCAEAGIPYCEYAWR